MNPVRILIDGHNLIPHIPGLSLAAPDDEIALIERLTPYARRGRHHIEVFFDGAPPGQAGARNYGTVTARFVSARTIADHAIRTRLKELGGETRHTLVVSSDRQVQSEARAAGARTRSGEQFAQELLAELPAGRQKPARRPAKDKKNQVEPPLPPDQVQDWLNLFKDGKK